MGAGQEPKVPQRLIHPTQSCSPHRSYQGRGGIPSGQNEGLCEGGHHNCQGCGSEDQVCPHVPAPSPTCPSSARRLAGGCASLSLLSLVKQAPSQGEMMQGHCILPLLPLSSLFLPLCPHFHFPFLIIWLEVWPHPTQFPEKAMAAHPSTLAWKIPWTEELGRLRSMGSLSQARLSDFTFPFHFHALEKEMATIPVFLPGEPQGRGSLVGCSLWGRTESDTTEAT